MRIIGGSLKGKTILPPANYQARPTTDFAKEGLFNILINEFDFETLSVLDLFAGTGAIGMEFASRGCTDIIGVEMNPLHVRFIKQCIASLRIRGMQIVRHNVFDFIGICTRQFDLVFADPPYQTEGLESLPDRILEKRLITEHGYFILEHPGTFSFQNHPHFVKERKYGNVHFSFFRPEFF